MFEIKVTSELTIFGRDIVNVFCRGRKIPSEKVHFATAPIQKNITKVSHNYVTFNNVSFCRITFFSISNPFEDIVGSSFAGHVLYMVEKKKKIQEKKKRSDISMARVKLTEISKKMSPTENIN